MRLNLISMVVAEFEPRQPEIYPLLSSTPQQNRDHKSDREKSPTRLTEQVQGSD